MSLVVNNPFVNSAGYIKDPSLIPGSGRSPGGGHGNPLQYSCLGNPMDRGAWWATVHSVAKSQTRLKDFAPRRHKTTLVIQPSILPLSLSLSSSMTLS